VINAALGQAFFSLSLGMGAMITYGSYLAAARAFPRGDVGRRLDTAIALLAGFIIFPPGFSIPGFDPSTGGAGLIFTVLPRLFATLPGGSCSARRSSCCSSMAALTSTISLLEVPVSHLIDEHGWSRQQAVVT
jgi:neurotransmitter:Na+ symporter, NSS family